VGLRCIALERHRAYCSATIPSVQEAVAEQFIERSAVKKRTARSIELLIRRELLSRQWADKPIGDVSRDDIVGTGHETDRHHDQNKNLWKVFHRGGSARG